MRTRQQVLQVSKVVGVYCRERLGGQMFGRRRGGGVRVRSLSNIYSVGVLHGKKEEKLY